MWWLALAVLLINDNLLKGHGIVPGWLTGKLSGFAFLIVAPLVFAAVLPRALPLRRSIAILSVAGVYTAAELSPAAETTVIATAARLGMHWRLWADPSDLLALLVLPWTWKLLQPTAAARVPPGAARHPLVERLAIALGAFACLATSSNDDFEHHPFFVNRTSESVEVRITWVLKSVPCTTPGEIADALGPNDLDDVRTISVAPGQVAVLDGPPPAGESPVGVCHVDGLASFVPQTPNSCVAAILEADGANPVLMLARPGWTEQSDNRSFFSCSESGPPPESKCQPELNRAQDPGPDAVSLLVAATRPRFEAKPTTDGANVSIIEIDLAQITSRTPNADGCRALRDEYRELLTQTSCELDKDCQGVAPLPLTGEGGACIGLTVNQAVAPRIGMLAASWSKSCIANPRGCQAGARPVCRDGMCESLCALEPDLPQCATPCRGGPVSMTQLCALNLSCLDDAGDSCGCEDHELVCRPRSASESACLVACPPPLANPADAAAAGSSGSR